MITKWGLDAGVAAAALAAVCIAWFAGGAPSPVGFPLDDAWIHMVYGRNLAEHGLLAYNPGVASTGATSPLWAILVAVAHLIGRGDVNPTIVVVYVFGCLLHITVAVLAARVTLEITNDRVSAAVAGLLVALSSALATAAFSGMEVALTAALLLAGVLACIRGTWTWAGVWLALAGLARPETAIVSMVCFAYVAWTTRGSSVRERGVALVRLTVPSVIAGGAIVAFALWATGRALPATFYMKQQASVGDLPARIKVAVGGLLVDVPPLQTGLAYLFLAGLVIGCLRPQGPRGRLLLPAIAGLAFVLANLALIPPAPGVFYHLRYLLPAVPLLVVGIVLGAHALGTLPALSGRRRFVPLGILLALGLFETATSFGTASRRLHNDTRNIDEVQRTLGTWLAEHTVPGTWIATSDAGAVHYFANRPAIDVMGLNTPELYWDATWASAHPVAALALIPCWFHPDDPRGMRLATKASTERYSVTQLQCMHEQIVVTCVQPSPLAFQGMRRFSLRCDPTGLR